MIHDRLLRPAMVGVSKGGPKPEAGPEAAEEKPGAADEEDAKEDTNEGPSDAAGADKEA